MSARSKARKRALDILFEADLRGVDQPGVDELGVALRLRSGEPLELAALDHRRVS